MSWRERAAQILRNEAGGEPSKPPKPTITEVLTVLTVPTPAHFPENGPIELATGERLNDSESWALDVLTAHPEHRYGVHVATGDEEPVRITVAVRGVALCEVCIPANRWDGALFLELLEKYGGSVDAAGRTIQ